LLQLILLVSAFRRSFLSHQEFGDIQFQTFGLLFALLNHRSLKGGRFLRLLDEK